MSYSQTAAMFGGMLLFNTVAWTPVLLSSAVRRLLKQPTSHSLAANYLLGTAGFTLLHSVVLLSAIFITGGVEGTLVFWILGTVTALTGITVWAFASFWLPHTGYWEPQKEDELDGRIALGLGLIWYFVSTVIGLFFLTVFLIAFFLPT